MASVSSSTKSRRGQSHSQGGPSHMYSGSKSGSKSFDELDDLLSASSEKNKKPKKSKTMSSENTSRHSCDELMMTRSLHEAETSDTGSQVSASHSHQLDCQRCLLNTLSNRTMSLDCNELINSSRFISQRQY